MDDKSLVNPVALRQCTLSLGGSSFEIMDISFNRVVVDDKALVSTMTENQSEVAEFFLDRHRFSAPVVLHVKGEGWLRLGFDSLVPSSHAHLRSFLCPKKIGESLIEDGRVGELRHYHGLNESELWFDPQIGILFTYLQPKDRSYQFLLRILNDEPGMRVGKISREAYMQLDGLRSDLELEPLSDREIYSQLSECRDIVTNFRPAGQIEYSLKQRLLRIISDHLYSTGSRFEFVPATRPRVVTTEAN